MCTLFFYLYCRTERLPVRGGRERLLSPEQETEIINMVRQNNAITLKQLQRHIIANNDVFHNVQTVSLSTVDRVLRKNLMTMKQVYKVPFSRNTERVKDLRHDYVQVSDVQFHNLCILSIMQNMVCLLYSISLLHCIAIIRIMFHDVTHFLQYIVMYVSEIS